MDIVQNRASLYGVHIDDAAGASELGSRGNARGEPVDNLDSLTGEALLKTIKVPANLANLSSRLPKSNYQKERDNSLALIAGR